MNIFLKSFLIVFASIGIVFCIWISIDEFARKSRINLLAIQTLIMCVIGLFWVFAVDGKMKRNRSEKGKEKQEIEF